MGRGRHTGSPRCAVKSGKFDTQAEALAARRERYARGATPSSIHVFFCTSHNAWHADRPTGAGRRRV